MLHLITGGAGFIGSHLADRLVAAGHRLRVLDDLSTGRRDNLTALDASQGFEFHLGSILDEALLNQVTDGVDTIFHLAAAVGVQRIADQPVGTIQTNVLGTEAVLRAAQREGARLVLASSSEVYGRGVRFPLSEDDDVLLGPTRGGRWSYAAGKMLDEFLALAYHQEFGLPVVCCRLFNTAGPRQTGRYGMVIPRFVRRALADEPLEVYGNGMQTRCFCHVRDVTRALAALADCQAAAGQVFNIGSQEEIAIQTLAERIIALTGSRSPIVHVPFDAAYAPGFEDIHRRVPDLGRIAAAIGWRPEFGLDDILRDVLAERKHEILNPKS